MSNRTIKELVEDLKKLSEKNIDTNYYIIILGNEREVHYVFDLSDVPDEWMDKIYNKMYIRITYLKGICDFKAFLDLRNGD